MSRLESIVLGLQKPLTVDALYKVGRVLTRALAWTEASLAAARVAKTRRFIDQNMGVELMGSVNFNPTNVCNAKCTFCVYPEVAGQPGRNAEVMPFEIFRRVVDEAARHGIAAADLTPIVGDPLIDPHIDQKIAYLVKERSFTTITMTTNGILLGKNNFHERILEAGVTHIYISMPGCDRKEYHQVYGVDSYELVRDGIQKLFQSNRKRGEPAYIRIRFRNASAPSAIMKSDDFRALIKPFVGAKVSFTFTQDFDNWAGSVGPDKMAGQMRLRKPISDIRVPCRSLFGCRILADGTVRICGCRMKFNEKDDLIVGNVTQEPLDNILKSDRVRQIIQNFYDGNRPAVCQACTVYSPVTVSWLKKRAANSVKAR